MVKIVSGMNPQQGLEAYLSGGNQQFKIDALQQQAQQAEDERRQRYAQMAQEATLKYKQEQGKALEEANKRAAMGDAQAMEQQNMEARAQGLPPERKRLIEMSGIIKDIPDADAKEYAFKDFVNYEKDLRDAEEKKYALGMIDVATKDGLIDPEAAKAELDSGVNPKELAARLGKQRTERRQDAVAMEGSGKAIAKARSLLEHIDDENDQAKALEVITALEQSPTAQANPNAGKVMLGLVQKLAAKGQASSRIKDMERQPHEPYGFGLLGEGPAMTGGPRGPEGPTPGTHATLQGFNKLKNSIRSTVIDIGNQTDDDVEFANMLKAAGVPLDARTQAAVRDIIAEEEAKLGGAAE